MTDLRFALRLIAKSPGYTAVVVLTLALGIAVNAQVFAIISAIFLQPMPVRDADRLTLIAERSDMFSMPHGLSLLDFKDIREGSTRLTNHVAFFFCPAHLSTEGRTPQRAWIEAVTPDAFERYGVTTVMGRPLQPADGEMPPGAPVTVLTHRLWQDMFGGDPGVINRTIIINAKPFTIVGVARPDFESFSYSVSAGLFIPSGALSQVHSSGTAFFEHRAAKAWRVLSHRSPDATLAEANAELALIADRLAQDHPAEHRNSRFQAVSEQRARPDPAVADFMPVFIALFSGLVLMVLLIACANVANLMGARALSRQRELVMRAALGAPRSRLVRLMLVESTVLAVLAGIVGYLLVIWGSGLIERFAPQGDMPTRQAETPGGMLILFTVAVSLLAGFASGIMPALRSSRVDLNESLKQGAGHAVGGPRHRLRNLLVIGQVAVSCVVLAASALFLRALDAASGIEYGFRPERLLMVSVDVGLQGYDQERGLQFQKQLLDDVRALPGVEGATFAQHIPFGNNITITHAFPENSTAAIEDGRLAISHSAVHPNFIQTMGVMLVRGRDLAETDDAGAPKVAVINEAMAATLWPGKEALGQRFRLDWDGADPIEVVGVVQTGKYTMLTEEPKPYFYVPFAQRYASPATLIVRTAGHPSTLARSVHDAVQRLDRDLPAYDLTTFEEHLGQSVFALMPLRIGATLAGVQGVLALLLAVLGLYAVVSYGVTGRTREIGVRMALGSTSRNILGLVAREGLRLTVIGIVLGAVFAIVVGFGISHVVYGLQPFDPVALPTVVLLLLATSALACWLPARRATRVDPLTALRSE